MSEKKLPGRYKGTRKRQPPPVIVQIECPGCGWKGNPNKLWPAEAEYVLHLNDVHYSVLECAFCSESVSRGIRCLPDFATLAAHCSIYHRDILDRLRETRGYAVEEGSIPAGAFKP